MANRNEDDRNRGGWFGGGRDRDEERSGSGNSGGSYGSREREWSPGQREDWRGGQGGYGSQGQGGQGGQGNQSYGNQGSSLPGGGQSGSNNYGGYGIRQANQGGYGSSQRGYGSNRGGQGGYGSAGGDSQQGGFGSGSNSGGGYGTTGRTYGGSMSGGGMRSGIGMSGTGGSQSWEGPHTGRGPQGYQRSTESIREEICEHLTRHGHVDASGIRVNVENGEVTLEGTVKTRREKRLAEDILDNISGVRDVHNRLRVESGESNGGDRQQQGAQGSTGSPSATGTGGNMGGNTGGNMDTETTAGRSRKK